MKIVSKKSLVSKQQLIGLNWGILYPEGGNLNHSTTRLLIKLVGLFVYNRSMNWAEREASMMHTIL